MEQIHSGYMPHYRGGSGLPLQAENLVPFQMSVYTAFGSLQGWIHFPVKNNYGFSSQNMFCICTHSPAGTTILLYSYGKLLKEHIAITIVPETYFSDFCWVSDIRTIGRLKLLMPRIAKEWIMLKLHISRPQVRPAENSESKSGRASLVSSLIPCWKQKRGIRTRGDKNQCVFLMDFLN